MTPASSRIRKSPRLENQTTASPPATRKSERLVRAPPPPSPAPPAAARKSDRSVSVPASPLVTRKSERLVKVSTPSPLRRPGRSKKRSLEGFGEGSNSSEAKKKGEKKKRSIQMLQMETTEVSTEYGQQSFRPKRRLDGRSYKALFMTQRRRHSTPDNDEEVRRSEALSRIDQIDNGVIGYQSSGDKEDLGNELCRRMAEDLRKECTEGISEGAFIRSHSGSNESDAHAAENGVGADIASLVSEHDLSEKPLASVEGNIVGLTFGCSNGHENYSDMQNMQMPDAHAVTNDVEGDIASPSPDHGLSEKPRNASNEGNIDGLNIGFSGGHKDDSAVQNMQTPELAAPSSLPASEKLDFVATCFLCSKKRRLVHDSPEEELCSCTNALNGNLSDAPCLKSTKGSFVKLQKLPVGGSTTASDSLLDNVNKLREFWYKNQNAVIVDENERMVNLIYFIFSLSDVHKPFLITATSNTLAQWEAVFIRLVPSVNVVVYHANRGTKNSIKSVEFHREEGGKIFQVLLCSTSVITEDFQILRHLKCEILILDECQCSVNFDPLKMLDADMRILLFSGSLKDRRDEYLSLLSFLHSPSVIVKADCFKYDQTDGLVKLREAFSRFVAYDCGIDTSKFVEYWVPVPVSNLQLEQYCHALHSGSSTLTSNNMKTDIVGEEVHNILMTVRKCCDHPYLADHKLVAARVQQGYLPSENVDFGIKASGKLQVLYKILSKIKSDKLRALVLFQSFDGSRESIGDMLEDLLRDRFGNDSYERIDRRVVHSKKQAAVNRFGKEDSTQFVFLLENRACHSWIKLSIDIVVIFSSEWSPANDLRTLQRISIISQSEKIPIFRLYSSCTVEEKVLMLAKQHQNLDNNLQNVNRGTTSNTLLMWGASSLFGRLEGYHTGSPVASDADVSSEHSMLDDVVKDFSAILSDTAISYSQHNSVISKAFMRSGIYYTNCPLLGERKAQLTAGEEPRTFWKKLLEGRSPRWKFSHESTLRNRKRVLYFEGSPRKPELVNDEAGKKRRKMGDISIDSSGPLLSDLEEGEIAGSEEDALVTGGTGQLELSFSSDCRMAEPQCTSALSSWSHRKSFPCQNSVFQPEIRSPSDEQQSLHVFLKAEIAKLCNALKLTEEVMHMVERVLEYLMENHNVNKEDAHLLQAFQMSLCWIATDILGKKINRKGLLLEARKILNFECPEELADSVYQKLTSLKKTFKQLFGKVSEFSTSRNVVSPMGDIAVCPSSLREPCVKVEGEDISSLNPDLQQNHAPKFKVAATKKDRKLRKVQKNCEKRKLKLRQKHEEEILEFNKIWKEKREKLEEEHKVELAVVSAIHSQSAMKIDKLKLADAKFAMLVRKHERSKEVELKKLEKKHAAEIEEENRKCENWLGEAEANYLSCQSTLVNDFHTQESESGNDRQFAKTSRHTAPSVSGNDVHANIVSNSVVLDVPVNVETEVVRCGFPTELELVPASAEQPEAADVFSQNTKDLTFFEVPIRDGQIVDEMPSFNRNNEADAALLGSGVPELQTVEPSAGNNKGNNSRSDNNTRCQINTNSSEIPAPDPSSVDKCDPLPQDGPSAGVMDSADCLGLRDSNSANATDNGISGELPIPSQCHVAASHVLDNAAELHNESAALDGRRAMLNISADFINSVDSRSNTDLQAASGSNFQVNSEQSAECGSHPGSHTAGGPDEIPASEQSVFAQDLVPPSQVVENTGELHKQLAARNLQETMLQPSTEVIDTVDSQDLRDLPMAGGSDHEPSNDQFVSSRNPALSQVTGIDHEPNCEQFVTSLDPASQSEVAANASEFQNQAVLQSGSNLAALEGLSFIPLHHPRAGWNAHADPLQSELEKIHKEREQVIKLQEDTKLQLKSECEKEIQELSIQIHNKYAAKLRDAEVSFLVKKTEIETNQSKVFMNKILAEAFRSKCLDFRPPGSSGVFPGPPSGFLQHQQLLSLQSSRQLPGAASSSAGQPASMRLADNPVQTVNPLQSAHRYPLAGLSSSQPAVIQQTVNPSIQSTHRASTSFSGIPSRPPQISSITPSTGCARVGADIRAPAPHLQPFRPSASVSSANGSCSVAIQRLSANLPSNSSSFPPRPPQHSPPLPTQFPRSSPGAQLVASRINQSSSDCRISEGEGGILPGQRNPSLSAVELLRDVHNRAGGLQSNKSPLLPVAISDKDAGIVSDPQAVSNIHRTTTSSLASDVVCLSDDDN